MHSPLLKEQPRWCCWQPVAKPDGEIDRHPLGCYGAVAKCNDAETCTTFAKAFEFYRSSPEAGGLNFLPGGDGDLVPAVFDFDGCIDADGCISPRVMLVLEALGDTYSEYSPSAAAACMPGYSRHRQRATSPRQPRASSSMPADIS